MRTMHPTCGSERFVANERGETLLGFLVSAGISIILLASALASYFDSSYRAMDNQVISQTREEAKAALDLMAFDMRMLGAGMPLGQANFLIGGAGLGTAPSPLLTTATATSFTFRRNETGANTVLTLAFNPTASTTMEVASAADFEAGDTVYISDYVVGGTGGLKGTVSSKTNTHITIAAGFVSSAATTFAVGSTVERVTTIIYDSPADGSGITRDAEVGAVTLAPRTTFSLRYFNDAGTELVLPLTDTVIRDNLASVEVTLVATSKRPLRSGANYTATMRQRVGLRNLYLTR